MADRRARLQQAHEDRERLDGGLAHGIRGAQPVTRPPRLTQAKGRHRRHLGVVQLTHTHRARLVVGGRRHPCPSCVLHLCLRDSHRLERRLERIVIRLRTRRAVGIARREIAANERCREHRTERRIRLHVRGQRRRGRSHACRVEAHGDRKSAWVD
jgi:hypothetical protein